MFHKHIAVLALCLGTVFAIPQNFAAKEIPAKADNGQAGGIFGLSPGGKRPSQSAGISAFAPGKDTPKASVAYKDSTGTGPYAADFFADSSLPNHTIYAPKSPVAGLKLQVLIWGNGGCASGPGTSFGNFLREIASHGFMAISNGAPAGNGVKGGFGGMMSQTTMKAFSESLDWVTKGAGGGKYGEVDTSQIATAGQSCGGLEAYSGAYHDDRVKTVLVMNSGVIDEEKKYLLQEFKVPIAFFIGGPKDIAYTNAEKDYELLKKVPTVKSNLDSGHGGTYRDANGGKFGKAAVAYLKWQFKNDQESKKLFFDKDSALVKDGWNITVKNWT